MRHMMLLLSVLIVACNGQSEIEPTQDNEEVEQTPAPRPVREPVVDNSFQDPAFVTQWQSDLDSEIDRLVAVPDPRELFETTTSAYSVSMRQPETVLGDLTIWDAGWTQWPDTVYASEIESGNPAEAQAMERADQKWPAAQMFVSHGDMDSANRCAQKLFDEGSYKVAAMTAILTGDLDMVTRATTEMVERRLITKTFDVIRWAVQQGKAHAAMHIVSTHDFDMTEVVGEQTARRLARAGDASLLVPFIEDSLGEWEHCGNYCYDLNLSVVADIALLGRHDPEKARGYAERYLHLPHANTMVWVRCGEGCYSDPMRGTIELYKLVRSDSELRQMYMDRTQQFVDEAFPVQVDPDVEDGPQIEHLIAGDHAGSMFGGWSTGMWGGDYDYHNANLLLTLLVQVRELGDKPLTNFWVETLQSFGVRGNLDFETSLALDRELGLGLLGWPMNATADDLSLAEQYLLSRLQGQPAPDLTPLWEQLESPEHGDFTWEGPGTHLIWLHRMLLRGNVSDADRQRLLATFETGARTPDSGNEIDLEYSLSSQFDYALRIASGNPRDLSGLSMPRYALKTNQRAQIERERVGLDPIDLYPDTEIEVEELLAPYLDRLETELPLHYARYRAAHPTQP